MQQRTEYVDACIKTVHFMKFDIRLVQNWFRFFPSNLISTLFIVTLHWSCKMVDDTGQIIELNYSLTQFLRGQ